MANLEDSRAGLLLSNHGLIRNGRHWIPVSGEMHYSRVPRARWRERIRQMRTGGIDVVAAYVPWLHHVSDRCEPRFDGNLDVAAFIDEVRAAGLDVVLRIGPWAHGELRNGGFPDWVAAADVAHRTNDPAYLALVREWWTQLASALNGRCQPETVLAIQLENELYDRPDHIRALKRIAREVGFSAPLWTATAWGAADLPLPEVFPLYGGYGDGFWVDPEAPWDPSFRSHYFFSHVWDDPGIGADLRKAATAANSDARVNSSPFPPATCELGGGMATAYHRRPTPSAADIAAVAHTKIGNGSAWQGYYMYVGGTNPPGGWQESHATGYPNDMPQLSYDFHAPVAESGRLRHTHALLRRQHAFIQTFAQLLGNMPSHLPEHLPDGVEDGSTLRWAVRGDDDSGFLFINWHQPHVPLEPYRGAQFTVGFAESTVVLPSAPVVIPSGTMAHWPIRLEVGSTRVEWATASALTVVPGAVPTLVLIAEPDIPAEVAIRRGDELDIRHVTPSRIPVRLNGTEVGDDLDVLLLPADDGQILWVQSSVHGREMRLLLADDELCWDETGTLSARSMSPAPHVIAYDPRQRSFVGVQLTRSGTPAECIDVKTEMIRAAPADTPSSYGSFDGRPSAPDFEQLAIWSSIHRLHLPQASCDPDACLQIDWAGDVAQLLVDGEARADAFWDGTPWQINTADVGIDPNSTVDLRILPLSARSGVHLPSAAAGRRTAVDLHELRGVKLTRRATWVER